MRVERRFRDGVSVIGHYTLAKSIDVGGANFISGDNVYRNSRVGFVTPLRDGMNLVAKEYVAAQDPGDPGVLILSRFAGAAEQMKEALIVNPYDVEEMAKSIKVALEMGLTERQERHQALLDSVRSNNTYDWCRSFLNALESVGRRSMLAIPPRRRMRRARRCRRSSLPACRPAYSPVEGTTARILEGMS